MGQDLRERQAEEQAKAAALMTDAQLKSAAIRRRLAVVAQELRAYAATAANGNETLLNLANRFERQSRAGENV